MLGNLANLAVWLLVAACIVVVGWEEPIKYRFMSAASVAAEERALMPPPTTPDYRSWSTPLKGSDKLGHPTLNTRGLNGGTPRRH
jgi:hypothetical protein